MFKKLLEYNHKTNMKMIEKSLEYKNDISEKSLQLFSHILNAHQIWNTRISNNLNQNNTQEFNVFEIHKIENWSKINEENYGVSLQILDSNSDLNQKINYTNSKGKNYQNSYEDIFVSHYQSLQLS